MSANAESELLQLGQKCRHIINCIKYQMQPI